jgi:hypothetical protein
MLNKTAEKKYPKITGMIIMECTLMIIIIIIRIPVFCGFHPAMVINPFPLSR